MFFFSRNEKYTEEEIMTAVEINNIDFIQKYLKNGSDLFFETYEEARPNLLFFANSAEAVRLLAQAGVPLNQKNALKTGSNTPLHFALSRDMTEVAVALVQAGADINILNKNGVSPFLLAFQKRNLTAIQAMINKKPDLKITDLNHNTVLHYLSLWEQETESVPLFDIRCCLIQQGIDIQAKNSDGKTPADLINKENIVSPEHIREPYIVLTVCKKNNLMKKSYTHTRV